MSFVSSKRLTAFDYVNGVLISLVSLACLLPFLYLVSVSLTDIDVYVPFTFQLIPKQLYLDAYRYILGTSTFTNALKSTPLVTVVGTIIALMVTYPAAYALSRKQLAGRNFFMFFMTFTMYFYGGMIPSYLLMRSLRLINTYAVLMLSGAVSTTNLIISRTFFSNGVPLEIEEAAFIDGCSPIRTFVTIVLPLSKALIGVMTLYYGVAHWNSYFSALIYITDRSKIPLQLVLREILVEQQIKSSMMAAGGMVDELLLDAQVRLASLVKYSVIIVSSLPVLILYPFLQKYFDKGVMIGSIKG